MFGSLVPGFRGPGKVTERTNRRAPEPRRAGEPPIAGGARDDPRIRRPYTEREMARMDSIRSPRYRGDDPEHHHSVPEARDMWDAVERIGTIAPVMGNPSIDPANGDLIAVSYMCGYGRDTPIGHDAMEGVDRLVCESNEFGPAKAIYGRR